MAVYTMKAPQTLVVRLHRPEKQRPKAGLITATSWWWAEHSPPPVQKTPHTSGHTQSHICPPQCQDWNEARPVAGTTLYVITMLHASTDPKHFLLQKPQHKRSIVHFPWGARRHGLRSVQPSNSIIYTVLGCIHGCLSRAACGFWAAGWARVLRIKHWTRPCPVIFLRETVYSMSWEDWKVVIDFIIILILQVWN